MRSFILFACFAGLLAAEPPQVIRDSPSADARGSMPLGSGDIGLGSWDDPAGDSLVDVGKSEAWVDRGRLAKLGLPCLKLKGLFKPPFVQWLGSAWAEATVSASTPDAAVVTGVLWSDARHPHLTIDGTRLLARAICFELWRREPKRLPSTGKSDVRLDRRRKDQRWAPAVVEPDLVLKGIPDDIGWHHHHKKSVCPAETMDQEDLSRVPWQDPLLHRSFGSLIRSPGSERSDGDIHVPTKHPASPAQWLRSIRASAAVADRWVPGFVTRGHPLQRFMTACAGYPIKFNGSPFIVTWPGKRARLTVNPPDCSADVIVAKLQAAP